MRNRFRRPLRLRFVGDNRNNNISNNNYYNRHHSNKEDEEDAEDDEEEDEEEDDDSTDDDEDDDNDDDNDDDTTNEPSLKRLKPALLNEPLSRTLPSSSNSSPSTSTSLLTCSIGMPNSPATSRVSTHVSAPISPTAFCHQIPSEEFLNQLLGNLGQVVELCDLITQKAKR